MTAGAAEKIRLDKWLWHARFVRTRSLAARLCAEGRVRIDGAVTDKPAEPLKPGQVHTFALGRHVRVIEVVAIGSRRGPPAEARTLYRDLAPPTPQTAIPSDLAF